MCLCGFPRSARDDMRWECFGIKKSNGRLREAPSRGARLWVYLWRNLTHR